MKKRLIPLAILAILIAGATTAALASGGSAATAENDVAPIRSDGDIDPNECNLVHNIDACYASETMVVRCVQVFDLTGPVREPSCEPVPLSDGGIVTDVCASDGCPGQLVLDPPGPDPVIEPLCEPVPLRSDCGIDSYECNQVHNINACSGETLPPVEGEVPPPDPAIEPSGEGHDGYEMTVVFNTSVTQEDLLDAEDILRGSFDELEFFIQESFPPTGRAFLGAAGPDDCLVVASLLEAQSYVDSASCEASADDGPVDDVPGTVVQLNDETN